MRRNYCCSVLVRRRFFDLARSWISLDWHGILAVLSPLGSYHDLDFSVLCGLCICVLATYAPYLQNHTIISAAQKYLLLLFCHLLAVSLPRLTSRDSPQCQGYQNIHNNPPWGFHIKVHSRCQVPSYLWQNSSVSASGTNNSKPNQDTFCST